MVVERNGGDTGKIGKEGGDVGGRIFFFLAQSTSQLSSRMINESVGILKWNWNWIRLERNDQI